MQPDPPKPILSYATPELRAAPRPTCAWFSSRLGLLSVIFAGAAFLALGAARTDPAVDALMTITQLVSLVAGTGGFACGMASRARSEPCRWAANAGVLLSVLAFGAVLLFIWPLSQRCVSY